MKRKNPRHGSMQFWPRVRAKRHHALIKSWPGDKGALGFAGFKVGMTQVMATDNKPTSTTKGRDIAHAVTILECPPLKVAGIRFYKQHIYGLQPHSQITASGLDKELSKKIFLAKKESTATVPSEYDDVTLLVYTQPKLTGIGKKKPELFELGIGGKKEEKLAYAQEKLGKELSIEEVFKEGAQANAHAITTGKGFQGPVKRFGVTLRSHKSEKTKRGPGSLGGWSAQGHVMYRVAHAGKMGYHQRIDENKWILKIGNDPKEIQENGGFQRYGVVKNTYALIKGSVPGPKKRLIKLTHPIRPLTNLPKEAPLITYISKESKQ